MARDATMPTATMRRFAEFAKNTAVGGVFFLLPFAVALWLLGQGVAIVLSIVGVVDDWLPPPEPIDPHAWHGLLFVAATGALVGAAFFAGLVARRSIGKRFAEGVERRLSLLFPRYAIFKDQLAGNLGDREGEGRLKPVLLSVGGVTRIGLEVERSDEHGVTVYLPSAPDPWTGAVVVTPPDGVRPLDADYAEVLKVFERLGRGTDGVLRSKGTANPGDDV
ncbi:MAG: DUF502 domain-containing protein [Lacipirellulaceae bacterium]